MAYRVDLLDKAPGDLRKNVQDKLHNHYNMFHLLYKNMVSTILIYHNKVGI